MSVNDVKHVAIIMDGNGRWANDRLKQRTWGHVRGARNILDIVREADDLGVKSLTLYAFSTENWGRPVTEITTIFSLLKKFIISERDRILTNNIIFRVIGEYRTLEKTTQNLIDNLIYDSRNATGLNLTFAFGYGSRDEIVGAVNKHITDHPGKKIDELSLTECLMTSDLGDVDLLIRTGGDYRISNFLLWQLAYAELSFTKTKWPDFTTKEFRSIVEEVRDRERRFGMVSKTDKLIDSKKHAKANKMRLSHSGGQDAL